MVSASNANTALASQSAGPQPALVLVGNKLVRIASEANSNNTNTTPVHTPAHVQARVSHANTDAAGSSDSSASEQEPNTPILIRAQHAGAEHNNQLSTIMLFSDRYQGPTTFQAMGEADDQLLQDLLATCLARQDSCLSASDVSWAARAVGGVGAGSNMHHAACEADMLVSRNSSTGADSAMDLTSRTHSWANCSNGQDVPDLELERDGFVDSSNNNTDSGMASLAYSAQVRRARRGSAPAVLPSAAALDVYRAVPKRPPFSYLTLVRQALEADGNKGKTLTEIYDWIEATYAYYRTAGTYACMLYGS